MAQFKITKLGNCNTVNQWDSPWITLQTPNPQRLYVLLSGTYTVAQARTRTVAIRISTSDGVSDTQTIFTNTINFETATAHPFTHYVRPSAQMGPSQTTLLPQRDCAFVAQTWRAHVRLGTGTTGTYNIDAYLVEVPMAEGDSTWFTQNIDGTEYAFYDSDGNQYWKGDTTTQDFVVKLPYEPARLSISQFGNCLSAGTIQTASSDDGVNWFQHQQVSGSATYSSFGGIPFAGSWHRIRLGTVSNPDTRVINNLIGFSKYLTY